MSDWDPGQTFSAGEGTDYHIGKLAAHARKNLKPVKLPVANLRHNLVGPDKLSADETLWSKAFRKRSKKAHLKHPIMLRRDADGKHWIIDGAHRLGKAIVKGHTHIRAYVFPHDQMPEHAVTQASESRLVRAPLLSESYASQKEKSFRGGKYNRHTPREGHWLPKRVQGKHHEGMVRKNPKGKHRKRAGGFLRDEPIRHRAEPIRSDVDLIRTDLLLDHDKPT